jgi:hypothetical protein
MGGSFGSQRWKLLDLDEKPWAEFPVKETQSGLPSPPQESCPLLGE